MFASSSRIQPSGLPHGVRASLQRRPLISFFVLAYGFSWLVSTPYILWVWGAVQSNWLTGFMLKQWVGPALAGMIKRITADALVMSIQDPPSLDKAMQFLSS